MRQVFGDRIAIPLAVAREVYANSAIPPWIRVAPVAEIVDPTASPRLGTGEREAIALAIALRAQLIILDDLPARRLAASRGLTVIGTIGVLLTAKRSGTIVTIAPTLDALVAAGFHMSHHLREATLRAAGE